jgi:hypothetical protein
VMIATLFSSLLAEFRKPLPITPPLFEPQITPFSLHNPAFRSYYVSNRCIDVA